MKEKIANLWLSFLVVLFFLGLGKGLYDSYKEDPSIFYTLITIIFFLVMTVWSVDVIQYSEKKEDKDARS
jgi:hypothetical protein